MSTNGANSVPTSSDDGDVVERNEFGTFGGVFTPTILTILGVIMFMLANRVVGYGGILNALVILVAAKLITLFTCFSIAAISTNTEVRGGGAYFLISRSLGPEFGGAIGLTLYLAQALSVPFYIVGFTQALVSTFPGAQPYFLQITLSTGLILFVISYVGANWAIRVQYIVLAVLWIAIAAFLIGAITQFDMATFRENLGPAPIESFPQVGFWVLFALYFPAVTGVMTGVNMSGDLKDPAKSIPRGSLAAIAVGFAIYALEVILCGGATPRAKLIDQPYGTLFDLAIFGAGFLVTAGVFAATISSAIGSFVSAPRVLQALARDDLVPAVGMFARGSLKGDEPRRAIWLTFIITIGVLWGAGSGGEALESIAAVVTMFFLAAYGVTNFAAFVEAVGANPSFRPRFRYFHWIEALLGGAGCVGAALLVNPVAAAAATIIISGLYYYVRKRDLSATFGDARRGWVYTRLRNNLIRLSEMPTDAKNWRPTILVLSGNPHTRLTLVTYGLWLEAGKGVLTMVRLIVGEMPTDADRRREALEGLQDFVDTNRLPAFVEATVVPDFDEGLRVLLQAHSLGPLKPNIILFGWSQQPDRVESFMHHLHVASEIGMSLLLLADRGLPKTRPQKRRIDIWWRGQRNGSLMLLLAHLLRTNADWRQAHIRTIRVVRTDQEADLAHRELYDLVEAGRIEAEVVVVESDQPFESILRQESGDATVVLLGFRLPDDREQDAAVHARLSGLLEGLPTSILVNSSGDADLLA